MDVGENAEEKLGRGKGNAPARYPEIAPDGERGAGREVQAQGAP